MNKKLNYKTLLLIFIIILTRTFFFKDFFHEWDSINFALGIKKFNVYADQPHPPGYPIPVLTSKLIYLFTGNELKSLQIMSLIFSILSVIIFYYFMKLLTKDENYSFLVSVIFSFSSIFWFYGTIEDIYSSEVFLTLLIGFLAYLTILDRKKLILLSIFYGLSGGIRFNDLIFFFPLIVFIFLKIKIKLKEFLTNFLFILIFILIWYIPTVYYGGGYKIHSFHSKTLFTWVLGTSFFSQNSYWLKVTFENFIIFLRETIIVIILLVILFIKNKENVLFFLIWIIPSFLFYFFIHTPKVGYYLTIIPPIYLFFFYKFFHLKIHNKKVLSIITVLIIITNSLFLFKDLRKVLNQQIIVLKGIVSKIEEVIDNDNKVTIFISDDSVNLFRHIPYYLPNNKVYFITPLSNYINEWNIDKGYIVQYKREPMEIIEGNIINIDKKTKKLIFICQQPREYEDLLMLDETKIEESLGSLKGGGFSIISYEIPENFDFLFVKGYLITKN